MLDKGRHDQTLREKGRAMTLRRQSSGGAPVTNTDVTVYGKVFGAAGADLAGDLRQADRTIRIGNAEIAAAVWPGPPKTGDQVIVSGKTYTVADVDTRDLGGTTWCHILTVRG